MRKKILGPDGYERDPVEEGRINLHVVEALGDPAGKAVMEYLESITTRRVMGPESTDGQLRYQEGMRFVVAILSQRIQLGHKEKSNVGQSGQSGNTTK